MTDVGNYLQDIFEITSQITKTFLERRKPTRKLANVEYLLKKHFSMRFFWQICSIFLALRQTLN